MRITIPQKPDAPAARSGAATIWLLMGTLVFGACIQYVLESGWLLMCRTQAQAVAESAALAAARIWGLEVLPVPLDPDPSRLRAAAFVRDCQIAGLTVEYDDVADDLELSNPVSCPGATVTANFVSLGELNIDPAAGPGTPAFTPTLSPATAWRACVVQFILNANSPVTGAARSVSARAVAYWYDDPDVGDPDVSRLVFVTYACP